MSTISKYILDDPLFFVERGLIEAEEVITAQTSFQEFLSTLGQIWPQERLSSLIVQILRLRYHKSLKYLEKLELENKDARARGVSYQDRQSFTVKLNAGQQVLEDLKALGAYANSRQFTVKELVDPLDVELIEQKGFKHWLEMGLMTYPHPLLHFHR